MITVYHLVFYLIVTLKVYTARSLGYVYHTNIGIYCIPVKSCGSGHTIRPCNISYTKDECVKCEDGLKQPSVIYAVEVRTVNGPVTKYTPSLHSCFQPQSECLDNELVDRQRKDKDAFCDDLSWCACDNSKCYYGNPCLCVIKKDECGINQTLTNEGVCVPCGECFEKHDTGCGPCTPVKGCVIQDFTSGDTDRNEDFINNPTVIIAASTKSVITPGEIVSGQVAGTHNATNTAIKHEDQSLVIAVIVLSVALVVGVLSVFVVIRCKYMQRTTTNNGGDVEDFPLNTDQNGSDHHPNAQPQSIERHPTTTDMSTKCVNGVNSNTQHSSVPTTNNSNHDSQIVLEDASLVDEEQQCHLHKENSKNTSENDTPLNPETEPLMKEERQCQSLERNSLDLGESTNFQSGAYMSMT